MLSFELVSFEGGVYLISKLPNAIFNDLRELYYGETALTLFY